MLSLYVSNTPILAESRGLAIDKLKPPTSNDSSLAALSGGWTLFYLFNTNKNGIHVKTAWHDVDHFDEDDETDDDYDNDAPKM